MPVRGLGSGTADTGAARRAAGRSCPGRGGAFLPLAVADPSHSGVGSSAVSPASDLASGFELDLVSDS